MNVRSFVIMPQVWRFWLCSISSFLSFFLFFHLISLCCSDWVISIVLCLSCLILSSVFSVLLLSLFIEFLSLFFFSSFQTSIGFLCTLHFFVETFYLNAEIFYFIIYCKCDAFAPWSIFMMATLKSLLDNSDLCAISILASVYFLLPLKLIILVCQVIFFSIKFGHSGSLLILWVLQAFSDVLLLQGRGVA